MKFNSQWNFGRKMTWHHGLYMSAPGGIQHSQSLAEVEYPTTAAGHFWGGSLTSFCRFAMRDKAALVFQPIYACSCWEWGGIRGREASISRIDVNMLQFPQNVSQFCDYLWSKRGFTCLVTLLAILWSQHLHKCPEIFEKSYFMLRYGLIAVFGGCHTMHVMFVVCGCPLPYCR